MISLITHKCIALTWSADGVCRGLRVSRYGQDACEIEAAWQRVIGEAGDVAPLLAEGARTLGADGRMPILLGSDMADFGLVDLDMPKLSSSDLRKALQFELGKHAAVPLEQLVWGYRVLGEHDKRLEVRLIHVRDEDWRGWVDKASGLSKSVDLLMPAAVALDPVLSGRAVYLAGAPGQAGYLLGPAAGGRMGREVLLTASPPAEAFGAGPAPLAAAELHWRPAVAAEIAQAPGFTAAAVLGMYGVSGALPHDRKSWVAVPDELRPRHYQNSRRMALVLSAYVFLALLAGLVWRASVASRYSARLEQAESRLRSRLADVVASDEVSELTAALRTEAERLPLAEPSLFEALVTLTRRLDREYWVSDFNWNEGKIEVQIRSDRDDLAFLELLREVPMFTDIVPIRKSVDHENRMTLQVRMRVVR